MTFIIHQTSRDITAFQSKPAATATDEVAATKEQQTTPSATDTAEEAQGITLSNEDKHVLSGEKAKEDAEEFEDVPAYIQRMLERLEKLKEEMTLLKEELMALQTEREPDEATQQLTEMKSQYLMQLQEQYFDMIKNIQEALKKEGITDPGIIIRAIT
ncbi:MULTISPECIES: hypothetical protein [Pseudoalteromonas]|uniref:Uncharacterized protein n=1 Tax=Pseudoalteromonas rubra TaxID=43658 RepID=A0A5S3WVI4_9GAMM|nr:MULTISPECIES: hypothetical protein [Pseudoalteromonas]AZZ98083.1 hypothetical protein ELR70_13760 [Pseudoalteromonas sp. R3]MCO7187954.1 hypothetical protein [Pseudoalteromonas sp. XMcav2-N]TMP34239.1 hypothetical protein CWB98_18295 [Pseudoalteromonas rubra]